jgi:hypothetical protein
MTVPMTTTTPTMMNPKGSRTLLPGVILEGGNDGTAASSG